ncbi:GGDEF domain-containing protein [bacterium]|nr:GGDEF domain-containing protein [bacterium]
MFIEIGKEILRSDLPLIFMLATLLMVLRENTTLQKDSVRYLYLMIIALFVSAISSEIESTLSSLNYFSIIRLIFKFLKDATSPLVALAALYVRRNTKLKKYHLLFIPFILNLLVCITYFFSNIAYGYSDTNEIIAGPLASFTYFTTLFYVIIFAVLLSIDYIKDNTKQPLIGVICLLFPSISLYIDYKILGDRSLSLFYTTIAFLIVMYYLSIHIDISKKDPLTNLYNRRTYYVHLSKYNKQISGLILLDMNGLKRVNDYEGHEKGDSALSLIGKALLDASRIGNFKAYRVGGDEFIIISINENEDKIKKVIEKIREELSETKYSVSIGYSFSRALNPDLNILLKEADKKMYLDKAKYFKESKIERRHMGSSVYDEIN